MISEVNLLLILRQSVSWASDLHPDYHSLSCLSLTNRSSPIPPPIRPSIFLLSLSLSTWKKGGFPRMCSAVPSPPRSPVLPPSSNIHPLSSVSEIITARPLIGHNIMMDVWCFCSRGFYCIFALFIITPPHCSRRKLENIHIFFSSSSSVCRSLGVLLLDWQFRDFGYQGFFSLFFVLFSKRPEIADWEQIEWLQCVMLRKERQGSG